MKLPDRSKTPRLWQNINFVTDPIAYLEANAERYGDIFTTKAFAKNYFKNWIALGNRPNQWLLFACPI